MTPSSDAQESVWTKICHLAKEAIVRFQNLFQLVEKTKIETPPPIAFSPAPLVEPEEPPVMEAEPLPLVDPAFLKPKDPSYNLKRFSEISVGNAVQSVCSEKIFQTIPRRNAIRLGYETHLQYQTQLGDRAIAAQAALTALGILGISLGNIFTCRAANLHPKFSSCVKSAAVTWQNPSGQGFLAVSALLFAASLYAHRKGWLGAALHDRSLGWRQRQIESLFRDAAKQLAEMKDAEPCASRILENGSLIEMTLHVDLHLSAEKAKMIVDILRNVARDILDRGSAS